MGFTEMKKPFFRLRLETSGFYEGITFESRKVEKKLKKIVTEWLLGLKEYKKIRVGSFKDLFRELHEIEFPITIVECWGTLNLKATIIDNKGIAYYMLKDCILGYDGLESYILGRRDIIPGTLVLDRDFHYKISKDGTITLIKTGVMKSKEDVTNANTVVDFFFDSEKHTTEAKLKSYTSKDRIKIQYPTIGGEFDQKVQEYLFNVNEKYYYYDVFPILKWMLSTISGQNGSLSITAEVDGDICSEVDIVQGIVQRYTKTEIISEGDRKTEIEVFSKKLEDFLAERK